MQHATWRTAYSVVSKRCDCRGILQQSRLPRRRRHACACSTLRRAHFGRAGIVAQTLRTSSKKYEPSSALLVQINVSASVRFDGFFICVRARVRARVRACVRAHVFLYVWACLSARARVCARGGVCVCLCVCARARACIRGFVHARLCVCVRAELGTSSARRSASSLPQTLRSSTIVARYFLRTYGK